MSISEQKLKGLPPGIALSNVFDRERGCVCVCTLYSPGIQDTSKQLRQWVCWSIAVMICSRGHRVYVAFALSLPDAKGNQYIPLTAFCGSSEIYALELRHLLQCIGLSHQQALLKYQGWNRMRLRVHPVQQDLEEFTSQSCFVTGAQASNFDAARETLFFKGRR
jgi:hypothetical protein